MVIPKISKMTKIRDFERNSRGLKIATVNVFRPRTDDARGWNGGIWGSFWCFSHKQRDGAPVSGRTVPFP